MGSQAFNAVSAEVVYLGAGVRTYDPSPLDMALPNPRLEARRCLVSPANKCYAIKEACLLERAGGGRSERSGRRGSATSPRGEARASFRLIFASAPYAGHFVVPDGVRVMSAPPSRKDAAAARHRCARLAGARGRLDEPRDALAGPAIQRRLRALSRAAEVVSLIFKLWKRISAGTGLQKETTPQKRMASRGRTVLRRSPASLRKAASRVARLVAGPPAPDSPSRQFSSAAHARMERRDGGVGPRGCGRTRQVPWWRRFLPPIAWLCRARWKAHR